MIKRAITATSLIILAVLAFSCKSGTEKEDSSKVNTETPVASSAPNKDEAAVLNGIYSNKDSKLSIKVNENWKVNENEKDGFDMGIQTRVSDAKGKHIAVIDMIMWNHAASPAIGKGDITLLGLQAHKGPAEGQGSWEGDTKGVTFYMFEDMENNYILKAWVREEFEGWFETNLHIASDSFM